jgi:hypothetical protein
VRVATEDAVDFDEQLRKPRVGEDGEPVVARGLAVLEARGGADGAMLLQRFVRRIGDHEVHGLGRQLAQPRHGVALCEVKLRNGRPVHARHLRMQV